MSEIEALRERIKWDTPFFASACATVVNERREIVRPHPRPWQARTPDTPGHVTPLDEALERQRAAGQPMRVLIGKSRKLGFSTWVQVKAMQRVTQHALQSALVVAHNRPASATLFDMAHLIWERLPSDQQLADMIYGAGTLQAAPFSVKPRKISMVKGRNGSRYMELGDPKRPAEKSIYETMTAGAKGGGRASTPSIIHASEFAHWEDPEYSVGLFNAMPLLPETIGIIESTANGFNHFWQMWDNAVRGAADPETGATWDPLFYGWQDNPSNRLPFVSDRARERFERTVGDAAGGGDPEEVELVERFGVTLEQLNWRRAKINGPECNGSIEFFHQEEPCTPEQMFIGSGQPVFPGILVARAITEAEKAPAPVEGVLRGVDWEERRTRSGTVLIPGRAVWVPDGQVEGLDADRWGSSRLKVWEHPLNEATQAGLPADRRRPDGQYVAGCDTAVGADGTAGEGDWHAIQVLDHVSQRQVASYRSRVPLHDLPLILYLVGLYYNLAWLAVEVNSQGKGVVDALVKDWRYPMMYRTHRAAVDQRADAQGFKIGWETTLASKPLLEQTMGEALRDGTHGLRCLVTAREFTTYVMDAKNPAKHGAQRGAFDDSLMAFMIAKRLAVELAPRRERAGRRRWDPRDDLTAY